jgi:Ring finger domain
MANVVDLVDDVSPEPEPALGAARPQRCANEPLPVDVRESTDTDSAAEIAEANQCCICSEPWDATGPRRVVALRQCGHLFCKECITQWFDNKDRGTAQHCPICRKRCI